MPNVASNLRGGTIYSHIAVTFMGIFDSCLTRSSCREGGFFRRRKADLGFPAMISHCLNDASNRSFIPSSIDCFFSFRPLCYVLTTTGLLHLLPNTFLPGSLQRFFKFAGHAFVILRQLSSKLWETEVDFPFPMGLMFRLVFTHPNE